eukprot:2587249-Rhodomonas_salina.1
MSSPLPTCSTIHTMWMTIQVGYTLHRICSMLRIMLGVGAYRSTYFALRAPISLSRCHTNNAYRPTHSPIKSMCVGSYRSACFALSSPISAAISAYHRTLAQYRASRSAIP